MANLIEKKDRHLLPNWRSFKNTANLGELNGSKGIVLDSTFKPDISDLLDDWNYHQTIGLAGDILGSALVCNQEDNAIVKEVSSFVLSHKELAPYAVIEAANAILKPKNQEIKIAFDFTAEDFEKYNLLEIYAKINHFKQKLINNPYNPVSWVEIARLYSILGQEKKALRAIRNAYYLSPENRFVLRSAARFYVHIGDEGAAHDIVRKSTLLKHDPWLLATEISLAAFRGRSSKFTKIGLDLVENGNFHPFNITELASSLASLEMNSSLKRSKKLFEKSLLRPNDNSLAQAEWASQKEKNFIPINPANFKVINPFEACARQFAEQKNWEKSIEFSKKWFLDMPFAKSSVLFANDIADNKLKDHAQAVDIAKMGLLSHPNDAHLLNNIVYSLCKQDKIEEADKYLKEIKKEDMFASNVTAICLTATRGLLAFRKGFPEIGRQMYNESMEMAVRANSVFYHSLALINYIGEELRLGEENLDGYVPRINQIIKKYEGEDIAEAATELLDKIRKSKDES
jgi:pentatricopeptide repeat protein